MTDLLLITDVPRLRKIFSRLSDNRDFRLRIANNLEKGGEELAAEKPGIVFVQTHLSGLSPEIILMHLKKQLGRKRSRFVLLSAPAQAGNGTVRLYHGHIDTSLEDEALLNSIREVIDTLLKKVTTKAVAVDTAVSETAAPETLSTDQLPPQIETPSKNVPAIAVSDQAPYKTPVPSAQEEPSLVEQDLTYAPRPRMSVYSEFNSSFDSAVSDMKPVTTLDEAAPSQNQAWSHVDIETVESSSARSKRAEFLIWLAPVVIAVVVVTILQHKRSTHAAPEVAQKAQTALSTPATQDRVALVQKRQPDIFVAPLQSQNPPETNSPTKQDSQLSDKAVISAIAEKRGNKDQSKTPVTSTRLTTLPDFIPRSGLDKTYSKANPGWELYKGQVTEFKVFREGDSIKAIQVIDRGGKGVPESFMKGAISQVSKNKAFIMESSEKKEGFEIQRGHVAENLKVMYYRDDQGGKLRAFVLTWQ